MTRKIPVTNKIKAFFHCGTCFDARPEGTSPHDWSQLEAGWTELGFQVWCRRCECNVIHIDFEDSKHPANTHRLKERFDMH